MENSTIIAIFAKAPSPSSPLLPSYILIVTIVGKIIKIPRPRGCNDTSNYTLVYTLVYALIYTLISIYTLFYTLIVFYISSKRLYIRNIVVNKIRF